MTLWRRRWFELLPGVDGGSPTLVYWNSPEDAAAAVGGTPASPTSRLLRRWSSLVGGGRDGPRGVLPLACASAVVVGERLVVYTSTRVLEIKGADAGEVEGWLQALHAVGMKADGAPAP